MCHHLALYSRVGPSARPVDLRPMPGTVLGLGSTRGTRTRSLRKGRHTGLAVTARVLPAWLDIVNAHPDGWHHRGIPGPRPRPSCALRRHVSLRTAGVT